MRGEVVYYYAYDVANEIAPERVQTIFGVRPTPLDLRLKYATPKDVAFGRPLTIDAAAPYRLRDQPIRMQLHVFAEIGVVSVVFRVGVTPERLTDLLAFHDPTLDDGRQLDAVAQEICTAVSADLSSALIRPSKPSGPEAYTVFCMTDIGGESDVGKWISSHRAEVAGLLAGLPPDRLSDGQIDDVMRLTRSQERSDSVVIDWDAALVVDLTGPADDVLYVLEVANLQLEEFRMMDELLDRHLDRAYDDMERRAWSLLGVSSATLRKLRWLRVDLTKLADEVTHITKFVGDWYLARVYLGASERFHLDRWRSSVERRLEQLDNLYSVVQGEVFDRRMLWLEIIIVVFFAIDLFAIFWGKR